MCSRKQFSHVLRNLALALLIGLVVGNQVAVPEEPLDHEKLKEELLGITKRTPECMTDDKGLPKRIIITRNGAGLFEEPKPGGKRLRSLGLYERQYLFVQDPGSGFHRVGLDPWGDGPTGWVPASFAMIWDHNEILFLNGDSVPTEVDRLHVWETDADAQVGDPSKAVYTENIERSKGAVGDLFFPVLSKDKTGTLYKIGFLFGGDQAGRDQYGQPLTVEQKQNIIGNLLTVNIVLVIDATGSMEPYINEAKSRCRQIIEELQERVVLKELGGEQRLKLEVRFSLVAYRDRGDEFDVKTFVSLTNDKDQIDEQLKSLEASGGGDRPELLQEAVQHALDSEKLDQGALNWMVVIADAPPKQLDKQVLTELGRAAKAKFVRIDALLCGDDEEADRSLELLATSSGGQHRQIGKADELIAAISGELKKRVVGIPVEKELVETSVRQQQSVQATGKELGLSEDQIRRLHKFLVARGADLASETKLRTGWVRVRPGSSSRLRLHVYMPRWQLALRLSELLRLSDRTEVQKKADNAIAVVQQLLGFTAGDKSGAGQSKSGSSAAERGANVPELTPTIKKGPSAVIESNPRVREKITKLLEYWSKGDGWEHDHIWIPVDALP